MTPARSRARRALAACIGLVAVVTACAGPATEGPTGTDATPGEVTILAYDAFTPMEGVFDNFTADTGAAVKVVTAGDSGTLIAKAILSAGNPEGDVLWGLDNMMLSRAQEANLLESYEPVDEGDICLNVDTEWFARKGLVAPTGFEDLIRPEYKDMLVVQDPASSSPGLGFLLATVAHMGEDRWQDYWRALKKNGVRVVQDWTTAYTVEFSGSSGKGPRPIVVSYGSSPPAEIVFATSPIDAPPTRVVESTCFRQTEYVGVLRGARNPNLGAQLVRYLLDVQFQESMPLSLFVFPVNPRASLPEVFTTWAVRPDSPLTMDPDTIAANRDRWIDEWRALML